jgi:hypothetical protein
MCINNVDCPPNICPPTMQAICFFGDCACVAHLPEQEPGNEPMPNNPNE